MNAAIIARGVGIADRLKPCDLVFAPGTVTMLVGPNGAGKTSLLQALAGLSGSIGDISIDGDRLSSMTAAQRVTRLAYLGASRAVRWPLLVRDFVALGLPASASKGCVEAVLQSLDADMLADRRLDQLSTGECSRVMIARALAPEAQMLLLDEPCANLDPQWQLIVLERLHVEAAAGRAVILSIHDLELARHYADRVIVIDAGSVASDGPPSESLSGEIVGNIFHVAREDGRWIRV